MAHDGSKSDGKFSKGAGKYIQPHAVLLKKLRLQKLRDFTVPASPSTLVSWTQRHSFLYVTLSLSYCRKWGSGQCIAGSEMEDGSKADSICFDEEPAAFSH